jgi:hypothetical protein
VATLKSIVGPRPLAVTEVGYSNSEFSEEESARNLSWERKFFGDAGFEIVSAYGINDGPSTQTIDHYGFRRFDGTWKPQAETFPAGVAVNPPQPVDPPKEQSGVITTLRASTGHYVCAESGGGREVVVDRPAAAEWEQWGIHKHEDGTVSLQAYNGQFLIAGNDGYTVLATSPNQDAWERFTVEVRDDRIVCFKTAHGTYLQAIDGGGAGSRLVQVPDGEGQPGEWEFFESSTKFWTPAFSVCRRPLVGPLRVQDKKFRDDTGYRRVFFDSDFNLLRKLKYEPDRYFQSLEEACVAGYQGTRQFVSVGGWMDFWAPDYGVYPITFNAWYHSPASGMLRPAALGRRIIGWSDFDDLWRQNLREHRKRGLRIVVSFGDCQIITPFEHTEIELHERVARIAAEEGGSAVIAGWEIANEYPQNYPTGGSTTSVERMGRVIAAVRKILPDVIFMQGAALSEEPEQLYLSSKYGEACSQHTTRQPVEMCFKRTFGLWNWEGKAPIPYFHKPFCMMEPAGPNVGPRDGVGDDMYAPWDNPGDILGLYALHMCLGFWSNFFTGADVRGTGTAGDAWGYDELPALFDQIFPEDIATWDHASDGRGGIMYFFKGKDFRAPTHRSWDTHPPRPIANWTFHQGDRVLHGTGNPPSGSGVLVGTFV